MSDENEDDAHDRMPHDGDILGGPDAKKREDVLSAPGREPHPGRDIMGGPDGPGPEDELTAPGRPASPAPHDILGGPDPEGPEDIMSPHGDDT